MAVYTFCATFKCLYLTSHQHPVNGQDGLVLVRVDGLAHNVGNVALGVCHGHLAASTLELNVVVAWWKEGIESGKGADVLAN